MALRRGFKKDANELALEIRAELKLSFLSPLDPRKLAQHLAIPIVSLSSFNDVVPDAVRHFTQVAPGAFSAMTLFEGDRRVIVHNDTHSRVRQNSDLAHELAHGLLFHEPRPALSQSGCRNWNDEIEEEAEWLAGILLVPDETAAALVRSGYTDGAAARRYDVSDEMMRWRMNVSGARIRAQRAAAKLARLTGKS